jgi:hypothetical protein
MRKEAVFSVMQALGKADDALLTYSAVCDAERTSSTIDEEQENKRAAATEWHNCIDDFDRKRALALLVCEGRVNTVLLTIRNIMRSGAREIGNGAKTYSDLEAELKPAFAKVFAVTRRELGVIRDSMKGDDLTVRKDR